MKKKLILRVMAWLLAVAMLLPSAGNVFTARAEEGTVAYEGSVTFSDSQWWTERVVTRDELIGSVNPDDIAYVKFYSEETNFNIGYSNTAGGWGVGEDQTSYNVSDILWNGFNFKFGLSKNDGVDYTIKWAVITGDVEVPTGKDYAMTTTLNEGWVGGCQTDVIAASVFEEYTNGVEISVDFTVNSGTNYGMLTLIENVDGWPKLKDYVSGASFNSGDGEFITFGPDATNVTMTLSQKGVERIVANGGGIRIQGYMINVTNVTLTPVEAPPATPTPTPTPTPIPPKAEDYTTVGDILTVTEDMVVNGMVHISNAKYNTIIIPRTLDASAIRLSTVKAGEIIVEGGADYDVTLYKCEADAVKVAAPEVKGMSYEELAEKLGSGDEKVIEETLAAYQEYVNTKKAVEASQPSIMTSYWANIGSISVGTSADLRLNGCGVAAVDISAAETGNRLDVAVSGFNGSMSIDLAQEDAASNTLFSLAMRNSELSSLDVSGSDASCFIEGADSKAGTITVDGTTKMSLNLDADALVVSEETTDARVRVYSEIAEVTVKGDKNSILLPDSAEIGTAVVEGDSVKIYGYGDLGNAVITGTGANVAVYGAVVEGENDPTRPVGMSAMNPNKNIENTNTVSKKPSSGSNGEEIELTTVVNEGWGVNTNAIPTSVLAKYTSGVKITLDFTVDSGCSWGVLTPVDAGNSWAKLADYTTGVSFNKDDFIEFGSDATSVTMTLSAEGIAEVVKNGGGIIIQGNQVNVTKATLVAVGGEIPSGPIYSFEYSETNGEFSKPKYEFTIFDYLPDYAEGEKVKITAKLSSDSWYGGALGANDSTSGWTQADFSNDTTTTPEITIVEMYNGYGNIQIQLFWMDSSAKSVDIDSITVERVEDTSGGDNNDDTTGGDDEEEDRNLTYNLGDIVTVSGYGYAVADGVVTFDGQYQEIQYTLSSTVTVGDYTSLTVDLGTVSGNIAVKLYDANDQIAVWYGSAGPATIDLTQLDSTLVATKVAIMANSADVTCSVVPTTIVFSNSEGGTSLTYNTALTIGGYGYTIADGVVTFDGQYQEIKYTLPSTVTVGDYTSLSLDLGTVTGAIAVKLYDADGQIAVWYGSAGPATIDLTQLDSTLVATTVAIMANSADVTCSAMPATIVFTAE